MIALFLAGACRAPAPRVSATEAAAEIDRDSARLRHDTLTVLAFAAEGAGLDAAYDGTKLRRLDVTLLGEMGRARERFYFDSALFYVTRVEQRYDAPLSGRVVDSTATRYDVRRTGAPIGERDSLTTMATLYLRQYAAP